VADTAVRVGPTALTGTAADFYTVPGATSAVVKQLLAANPTGADRKLYVSVGNDAQGTRICGGVPVPAGDTLVLDIWVPLATGEKLQAYSDASGGLNLVAGVVQTA